MSLAEWPGKPAGRSGGEGARAGPLHPASRRAVPTAPNRHERRRGRRDTRRNKLVGGARSSWSAGVERRGASFTRGGAWSGLGGIRSTNSVRTCSVIVARHQRPEVLQQSRRGQLRRTGCVEAPRHDRIGGLRGEPRKRQSGATRQRVVRRGGPPSTGRDTAHRACQRRCQGPFSRGHPPPGRTFEAYPHRSPIFVPHGASCPSGCPCGDPTGRVDGRRWRRAPARRSS